MIKDRNQVVIRLYYNDCQFICPQICIFERAERTNVQEGRLTGFTLAIPRSRFVLAPHRVHFQYNNRFLYEALNPRGQRYRLFEQSVPLSDRTKQLALEADMTNYFEAQSFRVPNLPLERTTFRW